MKRILSGLLILALSLGTLPLGMAEGAENMATERERLAGAAAAAVMDYAMKGVELMQEQTDEDILSALNLSTNMLIMAQSVIVESIAPKKMLEKTVGELIPSDNDFGDLQNGSFYDTCVCWMDTIGVWAYAGAYWRDDYIKVSLTYYTEAGKLIGRESLEAGTRDDTTVLLFVDYDPEMLATLRVGLKVEQETCDVIYTKTLGESRNFRLDVDAWQQGEDFGEWNKRLLYVLE